MPSSLEVQKLLSELNITQYDVDPDGTDPVDVAWVDMRDYESFVAIFFRTVGTGDVDTFRIAANPQSNGGGTDVIVKSHALGSQPNAVGDKVVLEVTAQQIAALGSNLRYVSAQVEFATGTDEGVVTYVRGRAKRATKDLTADVIA